ncbi:hypothetical protein U1Q18_030987 [Sarracenia purpurea var. burkii]
MEDTELEEGEACYYKDGTSIDPDIALSYIDEKLQNVLGHLQKDFEGGVSAENLAWEILVYMSSVLCVTIQDAPQNSTAPSDADQSMGLGTASCSLHSLHTARATSGDVSAKQDSCLSSAKMIEKVQLKHEPVPNKPVNPADQRTLKVRIKVGSDNTARKNTAIYTGLGLISPSSSMGNSTEESGGMPSECQVTPDESPNRIIQVYDDGV